MSDTVSYNSACQGLAELSARLGADPLLVQAAGGNSSVKDGDTLWVKASGLWLRDALMRPLFVPSRLAELRARVQAGEVDPVSPALVRELAPAGLRPSIETSLHALMPHTVVLHLHAVDALAWCVRPDAAKMLPTVLKQQRWAWVPYARPGLPLTRQVAAVMAERSVDLLMLANHGLLIGADTPEQAQQRLHCVLAELRCPVRVQAPVDLHALQKIAHGTGWVLPAERRVHALATDAALLRCARAGVLYPDQVVFLGTQFRALPEGLAEGALRECLLTLQREHPAPPFVALPGRGLLVREELSASAAAMLQCLAEVLLRLPESVQAVCLPAQEAQDLMHWEAEKFRQQLGR